MNKRIIEKLKLEKSDLDAKISKLIDELQKCALRFEDDLLLQKQLNAMLDYSMTLQMRIDYLEKEAETCK